jgi:transcriptional regulator with XRE-family HTH domain
MDDSSVGTRIRGWRHTRQLSAQQLADKLHISPSYLMKIETGKRVASRRLITKIADALHVGVNTIDGQPYYGEAEQQEQVNAVVPELHRVLLCYDSPDDLDAAPRPLAVLAAEVDQVSAMRRDAEYGRMGPLLPSLLTELTHLALTARYQEIEQRAFWELARAYRAANSLAHKLGYPHLSSTALDRVAWAAGRSGDPLMQVTAGYLRAGALLRAGAYGPSRRLLKSLMTTVERSVPEGCWNEQQHAVFGPLQLKFAMIEARDGGESDVRHWLDEARGTAQAMSNRDSLAYETSFGPTNIRIHEIAALLDIGDTEQAVARVGEWGEEQRRELWAPPPETVAERSSHHYIDFAAAQLSEGDRRGAFASLQEARRIAPQHTRFRPQARETVATLIRIERDAPETLAGMARWMGSNS